MNTESDTVERRVGTTLRGKWTLERLLGVGGMAAVYVGVHKIGRRDAIKILHPEVAQNREIAARFEQEAHAVNSFHHPGAVEILDIDVTEDGAPFLVMELLQGESVETRIERQLLGVTETLRVADELLDVLAAAHATGIVHRDIKPDNLFLLKDGRLKVLDFGIARVRQGAAKSIHTRVGVTIGTLSYMPPEQVAGKEIDPRTDIFAVGCTLFRMLTGRSPHEGNTELELMVKMATEAAPPLASVAAALPPDLCVVIDRSLAFDRDRRYPDAATMQQDVKALRAGRPPPYASARLAAGDVPNPLRARPAPAKGTEILPAATPAGALPTSMPIPRSMMMPAMAPAMVSAPYRPPPTWVGNEPDAAMAPLTASSQAGRPATSMKEKALAVAAILVTLVVVAVVAAIWWNHKASGDEVAQGGVPSSGGTASARGAQEPPNNDGNGVSPGGTGAPSAQAVVAPPATPQGPVASPKGPTGNPAGPRPIVPPLPGIVTNPQLPQPGTLPQLPTQLPTISLPQVDPRGIGKGPKPKN